MSNLSEFKEKLSTVTEILIGVKENYRFCHAMHVGQTEKENNYLQIDQHLQFIRHSLWRLTIIELCKVFSTRGTDKYCLKRIIENLKPGSHFQKMGFSQEEIGKWLLLIKDKTTIINDINNLRDKIYAHSDPNRAIYRDTQVYFHEVSDLIQLGFQIIHEISIVVNEPVLIFDSPYFESKEFDLIKILSERHFIEIEKIDTLLSHRRGS